MKLQELRELKHGDRVHTADKLAIPGQVESVGVNYLRLRMEGGEMVEIDLGNALAADFYARQFDRAPETRTPAKPAGSGRRQTKPRHMVDR